MATPDLKMVFVPEHQVVRETFDAYVGVGFTEQQALEMVRAKIIGAAGKSLSEKRFVER